MSREFYMPPAAPAAWIPKIKICGITRESDLLAALEAGADFFGIIFYEESLRYVPPGRALKLIDAARAVFPPERVRPIGVFVNSRTSDILELAGDLSLAAVQLHGKESLDQAKEIAAHVPVIRAIRVKDKTSFGDFEPHRPHVGAFLFDTFDANATGGTGKPFAHDLAGPYMNQHPIFIAGGLNPVNVGTVVREARPYGVDVSSGVEVTPGVKNPDLIRSFVRAVRNADNIMPDLPDTSSTPMPTGVAG